MVVGTALADPATTRTVRVRDGVPAPTDGPYEESKEQLAGYFVIDCYRTAARLTAGIPEQNYLRARAAQADMVWQGWLTWAM
jgi:hypothetical protein